MVVGRGRNRRNDIVVVDVGSGMEDDMAGTTTTCCCGFVGDGPAMVRVIVPPSHVCKTVVVVVTISGEWYRRSDTSIVPFNNRGAILKRICCILGLFPCCSSCLISGAFAGLV
jgi:hypothetical protein